jgi:peptide/nickel transport system substrate-binding protein
MTEEARPPVGVSRRRFLTLTMSAGVAGILSPSAAPPAVGGRKKTLVYGLFGRDPGNLSPVIRYDVSASIIMLNLYDGLGEVNHRTRRVEPLAAEAWAPVDPLTWRVKLREGIRWHKGYGEATAEDLVYSWNYHFDTKSWQVNTALFAVESVKAVAKHVVEVKLRQPFGAFPGLVMGYGGLFVSKKAHQEMGAEKYSRNPIGNGPFVFESMVGGNQVVLRKNPDYWRKGLPHLEELIFRAIPDSHVRYQALDKGEVDFVMHPDAKDVAEAKKNPKLAFLSVPGWNWDYQAFTFPPHQKPDFPNQNKLVRQAISCVVDREAIRREIYFGEATVTDSPIPEGFLGYRPGPVRYPKQGDLKKARELMAQAGMKGYEVEVITSDKDWLRRELELVAAMVSQIGITYKIRHHDMGSFNNLWLNNKYAQLLEDITIVSPDPDSTVWWFHHSKGRNAHGYNVPEMDRMLDDARAEVDPKKREALYHGVVDRVLEDCPKIYHVNVNHVRLHKTGLVGYDPSPQEGTARFISARWEG